MVLTHAYDRAHACMCNGVRRREPLARDRAMGPVLLLHNVGPARANGSVHAKMPCVALEEVWPPNTAHSDGGSGWEVSDLGLRFRVRVLRCLACWAFRVLGFELFCV